LRPYNWLVNVMRGAMAMSPMKVTMEVDDVVRQFESLCERVLRGELRCSSRRMGFPLR
jgi:hypothetical protein